MIHRMLTKEKIYIEMKNFPFFFHVISLSSFCRLARVAELNLHIFWFYLYGFWGIRTAKCNNLPFKMRQEDKKKQTQHFHTIHRLHFSGAQNKKCLCACNYGDFIEESPNLFSFDDISLKLHAIKEKIYSVRARDKFSPSVIERYRYNTKERKREK